MKEENNKRLKEIRSSLNHMILSTSSIDRLIEMVYECQCIATYENLEYFRKQLDKTTEKELDPLLKVKDKPRKRIDAWRSLISELKADFLFVDLE